MDFRQGTCTSCSNSFRVPATFTAAKAKCPKCGGVVEIGPPQSQASASAAPAAAAATAPAARPAPAKMPPPKPAPAAPPPPPRAPEPEPEPEPEPPKAAPKPAPVVAKESVRSATVAAKERVKRRPSEAVSSGDESSRPGRRRPAVEKKKSPVPMIVGGLVVLGIVVALALKFMGGGEEAAAPKIDAPVIKPDMSSLADLAPLEGTDEGEWQQMNDLMQKLVTPPWGPVPQRAADLLTQKGKRAVPVILNGWKRYDFSTHDGVEFSVKIQLILQNICNGVNFGWHRETRPEDIAFNKQVIERWFKAWEQAKGDTAKWQAIAATGVNPPAK